MNLILLFPDDFTAPDRVFLGGRRFEHIRDILKAPCGKSLAVGKVNGLMGQGTIVAQKADGFELEVQFGLKPPEALPLTLILALPRPPMLKRLLFSAAMLGVKKIIILNFNRVEKSLWNSSSLGPQAIEEQLVLGLEQAKDTLMPEVSLKKRFKPFVQDELPALIKGSTALVAHPGGAPLSAPIGKPVALIIGPEGGILDYEIELLKAAGCRPLDLGPRILRTESVFPFIVGKLFAF
ncbi:MAG: 16S rRNA (uracil(1498)-N(3))-methyltransferase [Candidatus Omnitrophica bacterium]|nr:16S rRNA (uracil(1498)-N(3))-methyltransferase [Candidatus Omnitrophota bacterium]